MSLKILMLNVNRQGRVHILLFHLYIKYEEMQIIYSYRNETRVCMWARGKKRLLGTMDDEYVYYLDYGDGFIEFTEVKIPC